MKCEVSVDARFQVVSDANPAGEHGFTSKGWFLSLTLVSHLHLEQVTADGLWRGRASFGDMKLMLPDEPRVFRHRKACRFAHLTLPTSVVDDLDLRLQGLRPQAQLRDRPLQHLIQAVLAEPSPSRLFEDAAAAAIAARLAMLAGSPPARGGTQLDPGRSRRVVDMIEASLAERLSVSQLAESIGLRPSHFSACFRATFGEPPHRYLTRRRVERAMELIASGASPAQAALQVGFCDQSHLARHLRRWRNGGTSG